MKIGRKKNKKKELVVKRVKVWLQGLLFELASSEKKVAVKRTYGVCGLTKSVVCISDRHNGEIFARSYREVLE